MHITCVICSDLFSPASDVYTTPCGHIFHYTCLLHWLENSKTCPQCRAKVSSKSLLRLYVNVANSQGPEADVTLLQHKLDSTEFNMKLKDQEIKNIAEKNRDIHKQNKALRAQVKELELAEKRYESVAAAFKEQIKYFKSQAQNCSKLQDEIMRLRTEVKNLEQVQVAVTGSRQQVDEIIRNENSIESLALLAATLKKSLIDTDRRKKELQYELKKTQNELSQHKRKITEIQCDYENTKKQFESLKTSYEKEVSYLKKKFSQLQAKATKGIMNDSVNDSIRRITSESPVNYNRTPVLSGHKEDFIDIDDSVICTTPLPSATSRSLPDKKVNNIIIEDSPLPASSMGLFGIQRAKISGPNPDHDKFSIFKNRQMSPLKRVVTPMPNVRSANVVYDGLGGCSKDDIYPTPPKKLKTSSNKFKKLSANAGKPNNKKISEFVNLT